MESEKVLVKNARVIDPNSTHNGEVVDLLIENDKILQIGNGLSTESGRTVTADNLHVSPGWFDLRANFCDPGHEESEDIESGINAAIAGGFTSVALSPDTDPAIDSKSTVEYILKRAEGSPVKLYPCGAISKGHKDEELSEMFDMYQAGAAGFSQGKSLMHNTALLKLALQYSRPFAPALHLMPADADLIRGGQMHEGEKSTYLGLKGIPSLAEEISLQKQLYLARYAETSIHLMGISAKETVELLRQASGSGTNYTADVALANLCFTDEDLETYDTRYKVLPPLRTSEDRKALIQGLKDGTISAIASDHEPRNIENKKCEFDNADFGMTTLESFIGALGNNVAEVLGWEKIIQLIAINPRIILGLKIPSVKEGDFAELTFFDPDKEWTFEKEHIQSRSGNTPFTGKKMKGKALGICNNGILVWLS